MEKNDFGLRDANSDDRGIGKNLQVKMIQNKVPGFCTELDEALDVKLMMLY